MTDKEFESLKEAIRRKTREVAELQSQYVQETGKYYVHFILGREMTKSVRLINS